MPLPQDTGRREDVQCEHVGFALLRVVFKVLFAHAVKRMSEKAMAQLVRDGEQLRAERQRVLV